MTPRSIAALCARLLVGAILLYAGASKASAPVEEFAVVIQSYELLPPDMVLPVAGLLPWLELFVGWALILGVETKPAAAAAGGLLGVFLVALGSATARGISLPNCGCFGSAIHFTPPQAFLFDAATLSLCWFIFRQEPGPISLDSWSARGYNRPRAR